MKRGLFAIFCILALCSLLLANAGTTEAAEPGYERTVYNTLYYPTIDGKWTTFDEWTDGEVTMIGEDVSFVTTWDLANSGTTRFLVEFFSDNTTDAGDYWQICFDGDQSGGTAPSSGDYRIDIEGHTTLTVYEGTGSGWTEVATPSGIEWYNSMSDSPTNSTSHWILEMNVQHNAVELSIADRNYRLAVYDDNSTAGVLAWPPTDRDVPNAWGVEIQSQSAIPESLSVAVFVILSSFAVVVSFFFLRKRSKMTSYSSGKTREINYT